MGIKIMSAIFETEFRDLPTGEIDENGRQKMAKASSIKITMLALADHANDEGECWPGYTRLELKTGLSRQGVADVIKAIKHNGLATISEEKSRSGTNNYTINLSCFPKLADIQDKRLLVKPLDYPSQATLPELVKPLDLNHQLTPKEPPESPFSSAKEKFGSEEWKKQKKKEIAGKSVEWAILAGEEVKPEDILRQEIVYEALTAFERDIKFNPLPWDSSKTWERLKNFVIAEYQKDSLIFAKYKTWQQNEGKFVAMSNRKIKERPEDFIACWPDFLAHSAMYSPPPPRGDDDPETDGLIFV